MYLYYEVNSSELAGTSGEHVTNFRLFEDSNSIKDFKESILDQYSREGYSLDEDFTGEEDAFIMTDNLDDDLYVEIHIKEIELYKSLI